jgi:hypothetical protein
MNVLYHYTTIKNLYTILVQDRLIGNINDSTHTISLTRDKYFHNKRNSETSGITGLEVRLVLDRDKLLQRFKIKPFSDQNYDDEQEERVYTKEIYDLHKYIIEIHVIDEDEYENNYYQTDVEKLSKLYGIKISNV